MDSNDLHRKNNCPCGSNKDFSKCCGPYVLILSKDRQSEESVLISWMDRYSLPIQNSFRKKAGSIIFRLSIYTDVVFDFLCPLGFKDYPEQQVRLDEAVRAIKHNIMLSLFASLSCLAQGLFLQSGSLIRCCIEDSFVLLDLNENEEQLRKFLSENYSSSNVLKRVKKYIPKEFVRWYGHFSANFSHFGPFHSAPYMPRACYPDNYVIAAGLENLLLATYMFHVILELVHFKKLAASFFWDFCDGRFEFLENNNITEYVHKLQRAISAEFPSDAKKEGYKYSQRGYRTK